MINKQDFLDYLDDKLPNQCTTESELKAEVEKVLKTYTWHMGCFVASIDETNPVFCVFHHFDDGDTFTSSFSIRPGNENYIYDNKEQFSIDNFREATPQECELINEAITKSGYRWLYGMIIPKFGCGQYIVEESTKKVYVVTGMVGKVYECIDLDGNKATFLINDKERNIPLHAWTINDAEAGQILVTKKDKVYVNFKEIDPNNPFYFLSTWDIDGTDESLNMNPGDDWVSDAFVPANKQQKEEVKHILELNGFTYVKLNTPEESLGFDADSLISLIGTKWPLVGNKEILKVLNEAMKLLL